MDQVTDQLIELAVKIHDYGKNHAAQVLLDMPDEAFDVSKVKRADLQILVDLKSKLDADIRGGKSPEEIKLDGYLAGLSEAKSENDSDGIAYFNRKVKSMSAKVKEGSTGLTLQSVMDTIKPVPFLDWKTAFSKACGKAYSDKMYQIKKAAGIVDNEDLTAAVKVRLEARAKTA